MAYPRPVSEDEGEALVRLVDHPAGAAQADAMHQEDGGADIA